MAKCRYWTIFSRYTMMMVMGSKLLVLCFAVLGALPLAAQSKGSAGVAGDPAVAGDPGVARRYLEWAAREYDAGREAEALAALERGADYASSSSNLSYFLALFRDRNGAPRFSVLEACRQALETNRWEDPSPAFLGLSSGPGAARLLEARLLEAKILTELRFFDAALETLSNCDEARYETWYRRLCALKGLAETRGGEPELLRTLETVFDRFSRESAPVRLLFDYSSRKDEYPSQREPQGTLRSLVELALRRLPVLIVYDPELAYRAAPFMRDTQEARRYVASYRAEREKPNPASLPAALSLGLVEGKQAADEFFSLDLIDRELLTSVWDLLRSAEDREYFRRRLLVFSGVITEDTDHDGIAEAQTLYREGMIREYRFDVDQDRRADLVITFVRGIPVEAELVLAEPAALPTRTSPAGTASPVRTAPPAGTAFIRWEQYPAVVDAVLDEKRCLFRPLDYFYKPLELSALIPEGPDYPVRAEPRTVVSGRSLLSFAVLVEQPSAEFPGGVERIELSAGIPLKSVVYVNGRTVLEREYRRGRPFVEYADLDMDGRMETIRRYDQNEPYGIVSIESDLDGDGIYEYAEIRQSDGSMKKFWDLDRDGIRETEE